MVGADLPNLKLVLFVGIVVSLGAASGIVCAPRLLPQQLLPTPLMPSPFTAVAWLAAFVIVGWLGWRIHVARRHGLTFVIWGVMFASLIAWRLFLFSFGVVWLGAAALALGALLAAALFPLVISIGIGTAWACVPLVLWVGYRSLGLIFLSLLN